MIEEVTAHAQSGSLEDAREICGDGNYFPNNLAVADGALIFVIYFYYGSRGLVGPGVLIDEVS